MVDIIEIAKRRGFFWQSSHIHGSVAGFYDYGHLGTLLKRKWENLWRSIFLGLDDNFYEIQASVIMPEAVFKASGHIEHFVDPLARCTKCGNVERADKILEEELKETFEGMGPDELMGIIRKHGIRCARCKGELESGGVFNMLFPISVGAGKASANCYLTGETAQGAYVNFKQEFEVLRKRLPMGLAIVGKAFRNEIAPRNATVRMREFTQAELQIFFDADTIKEHPRWEEVKGYKLRLLPFKERGGEVREIACKDAEKMLPRFYLYHMAKIQQFYLDTLKLPRNRFRFKELSDEEKAFYNMYHWDIELDLPSMGFLEVAGIHYRTDHDLGGHQKVSKQKMAVNIEGKEILPHVLELSFGVDRNVYALLDLALKEEDRIVLSFPRLVSPYDAGVFPLVKKDGLAEKAREIQRTLESVGFNIFFDASGSIGRRYRRMDEIGVAAGITVDYESLEDKGVTIRDRDSMEQVRVPMDGLADALGDFLSGKGLKDVGKPV